MLRKLIFFCLGVLIIIIIVSIWYSVDFDRTVLLLQIALTFGIAFVGFSESQKWRKQLIGSKVFESILVFDRLLAEVIISIDTLQEYITVPIDSFSFNNDCNTFDNTAQSLMVHKGIFDVITLTKDIYLAEVEHQLVGQLDSVKKFEGKIIILLHDYSKKDAEKLEDLLDQFGEILIEARDVAFSLSTYCREEYLGS